jgi:RNA polymerase sigma-70 factor (ECF subfamily)
MLAVSENNLIDRAQRARFERAMLPHLNAAYNLARWLAGSDPDAQDVVQEACVRALTFFDGFHGDDGRAWLLTIVRNTCYDWLRKNRRPACLDASPDELDRAPDSAPDPETVQLRQADGRRLTAALQELPADYREVLVLRELEEMSYKQIAQVTDLPIGTVMSRLSRGRRRLMAALQEKS